METRYPAKKRAVPVAYAIQGLAMGGLTAILAIEVVKELVRHAEAGRSLVLPGVVTVFGVASGAAVCLLWLLTAFRTRFFLYDYHITGSSLAVRKLLPRMVVRIELEDVRVIRGFSVPGPRRMKRAIRGRVLETDAGQRVLVSEDAPWWPDIIASCKRARLALDRDAD